jgi:hypothetical protein
VDRYDELVLRSRPEVYWPLDDRDRSASATARDLSGNARHGTYGQTFSNRSYSPNRLGRDAPVYPGNSTAAYVSRANDVALDAGTGEFAFEAWMRMNSWDSSQIYELFNRDEASSGAKMLCRVRSTGQGSPGTVYENTANSTAAWNLVSRPVNDLEEHHVVYQRRAGRVEVWTDAVWTTDRAEAGSTGTGSKLMIGTTVSSNQLSIPGPMSHFAYYRRALSRAEIRARVEAGAGHRARRSSNRLRAA